VKQPGTVLFAIFLACFRTSFVEAHDFWLQPTDFWVGPSAVTALTLQVGHGPFRQRSPILARRVLKFQAIAPDGVLTDLHEQLRLGMATEDGDFQLSTAGTHLLVLQTDNRAQTHLPSIRFNDYLRVEGLTPALEERTRAHRMDTDGSERYSRCAKAIVQVGSSGPESKSQIEKAVGLPLEIVPDANPYAVPRVSMMPIHVIYEGRPLPGALVKLTDLQNDAAPFETHLTDQNGRAVFAMPSSGKWLLNVIWTKVLPRSDEMDFETVFSSLSFGFKADHP
jgi:uncharacterized GH25 family protein